MGRQEGRKEGRKDGRKEWRTTVTKKQGKKIKDDDAGKRER